jgi:NMD protein affecting ribosome stability and mRNA decay
MGDGQLCGNTIRVTAGTTTVRCKRCGTNFPPDQWLNLRRWIDHDREQAS